MKRQILISLKNHLRLLLFIIVVVCFANTIHAQFYTQNILSDLNTHPNDFGAYSSFIGTQNRPSDYGSVLGLRFWDGGGSDWRTQLAFSTDNNFYYRQSTNSAGASWSYWYKIYHSGNFNRNDVDFNCHNLFANGNLWAKEIKVALINPWSDFVFESSYNLRKLDELELFIKANGHLPEIPKASDVEKSGINIGEMQSKLLQKIEELTLYTIEQNKRIVVLENEIKEMKSASK